MNRKAWVANALALALVLSLAGAASALDKPPIRIVNGDPDNWEIKVWSYEHGEGAILSCQTLDWSSERVREIEPRVEPNEILIFFNDHYGNFSRLWFWFRVWNRHTNEYQDHTTDYLPARWGATWTWDGNRWRCSGCN